MMDRENWLMEMAGVVSKRSTCDRLHVGAIVVRDHRVLSTGYNGNVSGMPHCAHEGSSAPCESAVHAEANALLFAARVGVSTEHATLVTTHQPCLECAKLIVNAGITEVWFGREYRSPSGIRLLYQAGVTLRKVGQ